jgi:hypothetical protein
MRRVLAVAFFTLLFAITASIAAASSPHFKKGGEPVCTITGTSSDQTRSISCTGTLAGLGNADLAITTTISGAAVYLYGSPGSNNPSPGQNKVPVGPSSSTTNIPAADIKNGNLTFNTNPATLTAPSSVTAEQAGCPNPNWQTTFSSLVITNVTLTAEQPVGTQIFTCSASGSDLSGTFTLTNCTFS